MSDAPGHQRQCPTRADGHATLFAHRVTTAQCQSRQRNFFHRCHACVHNNARVAALGAIEAPAAVEVAATPRELERTAEPDDAPKAAELVPSESRAE